MATLAFLYSGKNINGIFKIKVVNFPYVTVVDPHSQRGI